MPSIARLVMRANGRRLARIVRQKDHNQISTGFHADSYWDANWRVRGDAKHGKNA